MKKDKLPNRILFFSPTVQAGWELEPQLTDFKLEKAVGNGSFGTVTKVTSKKNGKQYALKQIKKSTLDSKKLIEHAKTQVKIMYELNHPSIIKLHNHFQDEISIFLVLEYASRGHLFNFLQSQKERKFTETEAAKYIEQIALAIKYIHSKNIMHRDLKLQNILVDQDYHIKIADFGWSHFLDAQKRSTYCGTLDYLAPEMIEKGHHHDQRVDIWSIGVLIYELCTGFSPFSCSLSGNEISIENVKKNINNMNYKIPKQLSEECHDLIRRILQKSPNERLTINQIMEHPWLTRNREKNRKQYYDMTPDNWIESISKQMKSLFPEVNNLNNEKRQFSYEQIYKYTRPDSIINLKSKKKKQENGYNKSVIQPVKSNIPSMNGEIGMEVKVELSGYNIKRLTDLEIKVVELEHQHRKDTQEINMLKSQLKRMDNHKQCKNQIKQLMEQLSKQNKYMEQLNAKLIDSESRLLQYERQKKNINL